MKNVSKFKGLPKIPKIFPSRLLKPDSKHNPCVVAKTNCLNGGLCMSVGHELFLLKIILKIFFIKDGIVNAQNLIMDVFVNLLLIKPNVKEIYVKTILLVIGK